MIRRSYHVCVDEILDAEGLTELDKLIKLQNKEYYDLYDTLAKNLKKKEQIEILESNIQLIPENKHEVRFYNFS